MGMTYKVARMLLGLLMVVSGLLLFQGGFKEHLQAFKQLRNHVNGSPEVSDVLKATASQTSDQTLAYLVYGHASLMVISGALVIADIRGGGLLMALGMGMYMAARDNPMLAGSETSQRIMVQNFLKDLAVVGAGLLIFSKKKKTRHRKPQQQ